MWHLQPLAGMHGLAPADRIVLHRGMSLHSGSAGQRGVGRLHAINLFAAAENEIWFARMHGERNMRLGVCEGRKTS